PGYRPGVARPSGVRDARGRTGRFSVAVGLVADALAGMWIVAEALHAKHHGVACRDGAAQPRRTREPLHALRVPRLARCRIGLRPDPDCDPRPATIELGTHADAGGEG